MELHAAQLFRGCVTNLETRAERQCFHNKEGTAEPWIKEGKPAFKLTGSPVIVSPAAGADRIER